MAEKTDEQIIDEFKQAVNMTPAKLEKFLDSDESKSVGWVNSGESEAVGHKSGKRIVKLLRKSDYTTSDLTHMRKVVAYVKRHMAQRPTKEDIETSRWRYSLMNWGHDPLKKSRKKAS